MSCFRSNRGRSVLEVMTATGIMAVLTVIAVPVISSLRAETALVSVKREVMSALYVGRSSAIASNARRAVIVTPPRSIQIQDPSTGTTYYTRDLSGYGPVSVSGTGSTTSPVTITFDARGLLAPVNPVVLTINNGNNQTATVTVYATGKAATS
jgi:Tfp pilus assembly protein FimT